MVQCTAPLRIACDAERDPSTAEKAVNLMTDIIPKDETEISPYEEFDGDLSFRDLLEMESYSTVGYMAVDKEDMAGVPHVITRVTYWVPKKDQRGFVSCEATVGDAEMLELEKKRGRIAESNLLQPNEKVVYNDGGSGIRRQVTELLQTYKLLNVGTAPEPAKGEPAMNKFDKPWPEWESFSQTTNQGPDVIVPSFAKNHNGKKLVLKALRGLYVSEYSNDFSDDAKTWYLS